MVLGQHGTGDPVPGAEPELSLPGSEPYFSRTPRAATRGGSYSDGTLHVFNVTQIAMELKMHPRPAALTAIVFSVDGQTILSGDKDGLEL